MNTAALKDANGRRWDRMTIRPEYFQVVNATAVRLTAPIAKARYQFVEKATAVPWAVIAVEHEREASQSWKANLAQGDPWNARSIHVPRGRGPFESWEAAAIDALENCAPYLAHWTDWSIPGALTALEEFNGLGYAAHGVASPYVWASTDQYHSGKYISDGHFDPNAIDHQLGCAALLQQMTKLDPSISFDSMDRDPHNLLWVQTVLKSLGANVIPDGVDGFLTQVAVKDFQRKNGLHVDGIAGQETINALKGQS